MARTNRWCTSNTANLSSLDTTVANLKSFILVLVLFPTYNEVIMGRPEWTPTEADIAEIEERKDAAHKKHKAALKGMAPFTVAEQSMRKGSTNTGTLTPMESRLADILSDTEADILRYYTNVIDMSKEGKLCTKKYRSRVHTNKKQA